MHYLLGDAKKGIIDRLFERMLSLSRVYHYDVQDKRFYEIKFGNTGVFRFYKAVNLNLFRVEI